MIHQNTYKQNFPPKICKPPLTNFAVELHPLQNPPLKMSTPTEDVSKEKVQVSTDLESNLVSTPVGEVSREKGKVSTDS